MKKRIFIFISIILILSVILSIKLSEKDIQFTEKTFFRNDVCSRNFKMYYYESTKVGIGIQDDIFNLDKSKNILTKVTKDVKEIQRKFQVMTVDKVYIYIIDKPLYNGFYIGENSVYVTEEDIENNSYRYALIRACYQLTEPSIIHGLTGFVFENEVNESELFSYYNSVDNDMEILGLFGGYFYDQWNEAFNLHIAKDTAVSLVSFLAKKNMMDSIVCQNIDLDTKRAWLKSIGVNRAYNNIYDGKLNNYQYLKSKDYSMIIKTDNAVYSMKPIEYASSGFEIAKFIYRAEEGRALILKYLKENASIYYKELMTNIKPYYYFSTEKVDMNAYSMAYSNGTITLGKLPVAYLHEYSHLLLNFQGSNGWQQEGLAEYLDLIISPYSYIQEMDFKKEITSENFDSSPEYWKLAIKYYLKHNGDIDITNINRRVYVDAVAYGTLNSIGTWSKGYKPIYEYYTDIPEQIWFEGNELSYVQATSFTAFLIDHYTLDRFIEFCITTKSFDEVFDKNYIDIKEEWLNYLYH